MKARVKATGEIVDVIPYNKDGFAYIQDDGETVYEFHELEILDDPDYWEKLLHQYAGMAMQGILSNPVIMKNLSEIKDETTTKIVTIFAINYATALVEKLKGE